MASTHWQTLQLLNALQQYLYQELHDLSQRCCESTLWVGDQGNTSISALQVLETQTEVVVKAEIPNVVAESLNIQVTPETVKIAGVQLESPEYRNYFNLEFYSYRFQSVIPLPHSIQPQSVMAELEQGMLTIALQKTGQLYQPIKVKLRGNSESTPDAELIESEIQRALQRV
jgi:HSP20 family protein